jgi:hypothetical protein
VSSANQVWRYWLASFHEFQVVFDGAKVKDFPGRPGVRNLMIAE